MRRKNISLLGLLAIVACAAIATSHAITSIRLAQTKAELKALRSRLQLIDVIDKDVVAARRLPSTDPNTHRWAVRIPTGSSKELYANWGPLPIVDLRSASSRTTKNFKITPDADTNEAMIEIRFERNKHDPKYGGIYICIQGNSSMFSLRPETTALFTGETSSRTESIGDAPVARSVVAPIQFFARESSNLPPAAFCLWIDDPQLNSQNGG